MSEPMEIDVFWSFRSPYSYFATRRLRKMQEDFELKVNFRPVYPLAIRTPEFFQTLSDQWVNYFNTDMLRSAEFLGLPFGWPNPDPVNQFFDENGKRQKGEDQPYIHRITRLGVLAEEMGKGIEFADDVSTLIWGGTENWHEGDHLENAARNLGLNLSEMDERAIAEAERTEAVIIQNQLDHDAAGHWGVPTCAFRGEPFYGQDRLDVLLWRLKKEGLQARS